jgi:hypothetical protein
MQIYVTPLGVCNQAILWGPYSCDVAHSSVTLVIGQYRWSNKSSYTKNIICGVFTSYHTTVHMTPIKSFLALQEIVMVHGKCIIRWCVASPSNFFPRINESRCFFYCCRFFKSIQIMKSTIAIDQKVHGLFQRPIMGGLYLIVRQKQLRLIYVPYKLIHNEYLSCEIIIYHEKVIVLHTLT